MNLKELYQTAKNELETLTSLENADFRLEQAEFNKNEKVWEVVVSFLVETIEKPNSPLGKIVGTQPFQRVYKTVKINDNNEIVGLYIFSNGHN
jgi:hypothetical protein